MAGRIAGPVGSRLPALILTVDLIPGMPAEEYDDQVAGKKQGRKVKASIQIEVNGKAVDQQPIGPIFQHLPGHHVGGQHAAPSGEGVEKGEGGPGIERQPAS